MILNRYISKEFFKVFFFTAGVFTLIIQLGHLFDRLEIFVKTQVPPHIIFVYLMCMVPLWLMQALPVCTLIASVTTIGSLSLRGELFCLRSSGVSSRRVLLPLFAIGLFLTASTFVMGDWVMPQATAHAKNLYRTHVDKQGIQKLVWEDIIVLLKDKKRITAKKLDISHNEMETVTVEEYGNEFHLRQVLTAKKAEWDARHNWTFYDGVIRMFSEDGNEIIHEQAFFSAQLQISERPTDLAPLQIQPEELSSSQLKSYIQKINALGISALRETVQYHLKIAFPFTHILVLMIGLPIAFQTTPAGGGRGKKSFGHMKSLAMALAISFGYYALVTLGVALGESRRLTPWLAVWIGNFIFATVGIYSLRKIE